MKRVEALELAFHRALRGEVPPSIRAIVATVDHDTVNVVVFACNGLDGPAFAETIDSELDQVLPTELVAAPRTCYSFRPALEFRRTPNDLLFVDNPWAHDQLNEPA